MSNQVSGADIKKPVRLKPLAAFVDTSLRNAAARTDEAALMARWDEQLAPGMDEFTARSLSALDQE
jgi:hypothetical protein